MQRKITILTLLALAAVGTACAAMRSLSSPTLVLSAHSADRSIRRTQEAEVSASHCVPVGDERVNWRKACRGAEDDAMLNAFLAKHHFPTLDQDAQDAGAIHAKNFLQQTPLYVASQKGNAAIAILLIARGADVNAGNDDGDTPLHCVAYSFHADNHAEIATLLLAHGADVNARNKRGRGLTPLHYAANNGHTEVATLFIAHNADVNARDLFGRTPLQEAICTNATDMIALLRAHGAQY